MKYRLLAWMGAVMVVFPAGAGATSVNLPLSHGGGPYLAGFEVETMIDNVDGEELSSTRYLGRFSWQAFDMLALSLRMGVSEINVSSMVHGSLLTFRGRPKFAAGVGTTYLVPLRKNFLSFFADGQLLYTLSHGRTSFETTVQSSTFREEYENRYTWDEYQGALGFQVEIPWARIYSGGVIRAVEGTVSRKTYQTGDLVSASSEEFSEGPQALALLGFDISLPGTMALSFTGRGRDDRHYSWTVAISEFTR